MATLQGLTDQATPSYLDNGQAPEDALAATASVPWVGIAFAVHVILLMVAWFVLPSAPSQIATTVLQSSTESIADPPPPVQPPEEQLKVPDHRDIDATPVEDQRLVPEDSDHAEDPTESPNRDLAANPNDDPSPAESPSPDRTSPSSSVGLKGKPGGGGGEGGPGGNFRHRPRAGRDGVPPEDKNLNAALEWLKHHQNREGYWSATTFSQDSSRTGAKRTYNIEFSNVGVAGGDTGWEATCDVGLTALSMLAFTGFGYDHTGGEYRDTLRRAVLYLRKVQDNDGCFGDKVDDQFVYNHAIATMALAELYGLSGEPLLRPICDRAIDFILKAQNPGLGWRYGVQPMVNDTSVTGWMVLTLHTCDLAGLTFDKSKCYSDAQSWFELVTVDSGGYKKCGYETPGSFNARLRSAQGVFDHNPSMDAIYVMSMLFMGSRELGSRDIRDMAKVCVEKDFLPRWEHKKLDYYYWYYASLALFQVGGNQWQQWEGAIFKTLADHQRGFTEHDRQAGQTSAQALDEHGSWDPVDAWGEAGGRVYATAINALTLETYYRHQRLSDSK
jgi:hypothetical protein